MEKIAVVCPCGAEYQVDAAHAGKRAKCAKCGASFVIQPAGAVKEPDPPPAAAMPTPPPAASSQSPTVHYAGGGSMSTHYGSARCDHCDKQVLIIRNGPNHIIHGAMTILMLFSWPSSLATTIIFGVAPESPGMSSPSRRSTVYDWELDKAEREAKERREQMQTTAILTFFGQCLLWPAIWIITTTVNADVPWRCSICGHCVNVERAPIFPREPSPPPPPPKPEPPPEKKLPSGPPAPTNPFVPAA